MFLEFLGNINGHYNIIHIKNNIDIKNYIDDIPLIIDNKFNTDFLYKCYQNAFSYLRNNILKKLEKNDEIHIISKSNIVNKKITNFVINNNNSFTLNNNNEIKKSFLSNDKQKVLDKVNNNSSLNLLENIVVEEDKENDILSEYEDNYILKLKDLKEEFYPIYPKSINGYTTYYDIHRYLLSKKENRNKIVYPTYFDDLTINELNTAKRKFRYLTNNYELNEFNELCFMKLKKLKFRQNKNKLSNRHKKKLIGDYILLKIPYKKNYMAKLNEIHNSYHCSYKKLVSEYQRTGFSFKGIFNICKNICKYCKVCAQKKRDYYKREPSKQMIFKKPMSRMIADITELPYELYNKTKTKYLLNIIDHFSKYGFSFLCETKKAENILFNIKECFEKIGFPDELGTDNGTEFSNKLMKKFLEDNNVKFIHGRAYNPRSQGCVERFHRSIKIALICKKLEEGNNFNLQRALNSVLFNYNISIHSTIGFTPIEVFYSTSEEIYSTVYNNTLNSFKYINSRHNNFSLFEKVLLFNNFIVDNKSCYNAKKRLVKNKVKKSKSLFNICASISKIYENGIYDIIIEKNYKIYNLNKYDICVVDTIEDVWDGIFYSDQ